ncbi:MAG: hypothetical protein R2761_17470 [Acidimicrobiales bacterium]
MASYELIDDYLAGLRRRMAWHPAADDVIAEAKDHLLSAVESVLISGATADAAQVSALDRFGDPDTVAAAHIHTRRGGPAMPTRFTKAAGAAAMTAAALWVASAAVWLLDHIFDPAGEAETVTTFVALLTLVAAATLTGVLVVALHRRHGGLGVLGGIGAGFVGLGIVATVMFWFVMGWGVLMAAGMLLIALAVRSRGLAPTKATAAFGAAWIVGVATWSVLRLLEVGTRDEWGDYPVVSPIAITVGALILAPGLIGLGRWLGGESPAATERREGAAAT